MKQKLFTFLLALVASVSATLATTTEITVAKALEIGAALSEGAITDETYDIVGYVTQIDDNSFNTSFKNMVFWIADENNGAATNAAGAFKVFRGKPTRELKVGDKISVKTKIQKYVSIDGSCSIESVSSAPVNFLEESAGSCGNNVTWTLSLSNGTLTISGTGAMADYSSYTDVPWYDYRSSIKSIVINDGVTSIGDYAFYDCSSLTSVTIPNSVTSIGEQAFCECYSLTSITIPNSVTSIGNYAFYGCSSLTSITIPNSVTSIGNYAFKGCARLGKISLGKGLETIGTNAFAECRRLYDIYVYATYPPFAEESSFANYNVYVYVPCEYQRDYILDFVWGKFKFIECISSDNVTTDEIVITPSENEANVTWPSVSGAASYELVIKDKDGNIVCTLIFNANGQVTSIAFNAPSRNGVPAQTQNAGFSFTITGLDSGTNYDLTLTAKDNSGNIIEETTIPFHTDYPEGIENVQGDEAQSTKVIKEGQVLILRNGKIYTMQGQEVK